VLQSNGAAARGKAAFFGYFFAAAKKVTRPRSGQKP
jgi:hypothetical protein